MPSAPDEAASTGFRIAEEVGRRRSVLLLVQALFEGCRKKKGSESFSSMREEN